MCKHLDLSLDDGVISGNCRRLDDVLRNHDVDQLPTRALTLPTENVASRRVHAEPVFGEMSMVGNRQVPGCPQTRSIRNQMGTYQVGKGRDACKAAGEGCRICRGLLVVRAYRSFFCSPASLRTHCLTRLRRDRMGNQVFPDERLYLSLVLVGCSFQEPSGGPVGEVNQCEREDCRSRTYADDQRQATPDRTKKKCRTVAARGTALHSRDRLLVNRDPGASGGASERVLPIVRAMQLRVAVVFVACRRACLDR